ncbi:hypothetical protein PVK06_006058 [Gossypium arboreum]|uniref:Suppressor of white apricot N-terminal domain-containing protein n=1 Tax=Gossypium arboreum TaxID=29729 RepID=A0ABR0QW98_GOSAR|nr:hypothetical protein PVK06_006058 [Gossypium arboreum]
MWHEARRSERKVHDMMDAARKRAQRRAIFLAKRRGDPQQYIQLLGSRCCIYREDALYHATQDQQGLFDGRALLDFIREPRTWNFRNLEKSEEEEELEEIVNFERYRDLIKHRRRGCRFTTCESRNGGESSHAIQSDRSQPAQSANKSSYSQVGFSYDGGKEEAYFSDADEEEEDEEDDDEFDSDDSNDEGMEIIAKGFGVKRYGWLVYMDRKAKQEEKRQKEVIKGDPAIRKLSRKERRKAAQIEREREREAARITGTRVLRTDPYRESRGSPTYDAYPRRRSRSRSRSYSPSYSRPSSGHILEALHGDPASGVSLDKEKSGEVLKPALSGTSALAKLTKASASGGPSKQGQVEKKETPQERLKRIMNKQLNKQIKKDTAAEMAKKLEQERQRLEKLEETSRSNRQRYRSRSRSRSNSRSPPRRHRRSRSSSRSRSRRYVSRSRSRSRSRSYSRSHSRSKSRTPRVR